MIIKSHFLCHFHFETEFRWCGMKLSNRVEKAMICGKILSGVVYIFLVLNEWKKLQTRVGGTIKSKFSPRVVIF